LLKKIDSKKKKDSLKRKEFVKKHELPTKKNAQRNKNLLMRNAAPKKGPDKSAEVVPEEVTSPQQLADLFNLISKVTLL